MNDFSQFSSRRDERNGKARAHRPEGNAVAGVGCASRGVTGEGCDKTVRVARQCGGEMDDRPYTIPGQAKSVRELSVGKNFIRFSFPPRTSYRISCGAIETMKGRYQCFEL